MNGLDTETALFLQVSEAFGEERECESVQHGSRPDGHEGAAEWYIHIRYGCGHDSVKAFCDKFKRVASLHTTKLICASCGWTELAPDVVQSVTRIRP